MTSVLKPENRPASLAKTALQVWRKKRSQSKTAQVRQKIFHRVICLKIPFHPNQPTFNRDEVFFLFFLPKFCTLFS